MSIGYFQWTKFGCFRWTWSGCFRRTLTMEISTIVTQDSNVVKKYPVIFMDSKMVGGNISNNHKRVRFLYAAKKAFLISHTNTYLQKNVPIPNMHFTN